MVWLFVDDGVEWGKWMVKSEDIKEMENVRNGLNCGFVGIKLTSSYVDVGTKYLICGVGKMKKLWIKFIFAPPIKNKQKRTCICTINFI